MAQNTTYTKTQLKSLKNFKVCLQWCRTDHCNLRAACAN